MGVARARAHRRPRHPKGLRRGLIVDAIATLFVGLVGRSAGTAFVESARHSYGRPTVAVVVTARCFLPYFFIAPIAGRSAYATRPALSWERRCFDVGTIDSVARRRDPRFLTVLLIPLTFRSRRAFSGDFYLYTLLSAIAGRAREISLTLWLLAILSGSLLVASR